MTDHISGAEAKQYRGGLWLLPIVGALSVVAGVIILFKPSESLATLAVIAGIFLLLDGVLEVIDSAMRSIPNRGLVALIAPLLVRPHSAPLPTFGKGFAQRCRSTIRGVKKGGHCTGHTALRTAARNRHVASYLARARSAGTPFRSSLDGVARDLRRRSTLRPR